MNSVDSVGGSFQAEGSVNSVDSVGGSSQAEGSVRSVDSVGGSSKAEGSVNSVKSVRGSHSLIRAIRVRSSQGYVFGLRGYGRDAIPSYISFRLIR